MKTIKPTINQLKMLANVKNELWLMNQDSIQDFALSSLEVNERMSSDKSEFDIADYYDLRKQMTVDENGIAHIEIKGALLNKCPMIYEKLGLAVKYGTVIDEIKLAQAMGAKGIIYKIDSPGGTVSGIIELSEVMKQVSIPTTSYCSGLACSAGYWTACTSDTIIATSSALVGNIGAITTWADCTKFWEDMGVEFKALVSDGADYKSTFHLEPNETQLVFLQESINQAGESFRNHVSEQRAKSGVELAEEVWKAGWYSGEKAASLGLIDTISTYEEATEDLVFRSNLKSLIK